MVYSHTRGEVCRCDNVYRHYCYSIRLNVLSKMKRKWYVTFLLLLALACMVGTTYLAIIVWLGTETPSEIAMKRPELVRITVKAAVLCYLGFVLLGIAWRIENNESRTKKENS